MSELHMRLELINMVEAMQKVINEFMDLFTQQDKVNHTMSTWVQEADDRLKVLEKASQ